MVQIAQLRDTRIEYQYRRLAEQHSRVGEATVKMIDKNTMKNGAAQWDETGEHLPFQEGGV